MRVDGNRILVGAPYADPPRNLPGSGLAYVFRRDPSLRGNWELEAELVPAQGPGYLFASGFGVSAALEGRIAVVGAYQDTRV